MAHQKWKSTALLVIGMQNDFIADDGLARMDGGMAILPNVIKAVEIARQRGIRIVWVRKSQLTLNAFSFHSHIITQAFQWPGIKFLF